MLSIQTPKESRYSGWYDRGNNLSVKNFRFSSSKCCETSWLTRQLVFLEFRGWHSLKKGISMTSEYYNIGFCQLERLTTNALISEVSVRTLNGYFWIQKCLQRSFQLFTNDTKITVPDDQNPVFTAGHSIRLYFNLR